MKKLTILFSVILLQLTLLVVFVPKVFATPSPVHKNCLQIKVKFNAPAAWQKSSNNRSIQVGCAGQVTPTGSRSCEGAIKTLKPGEATTLGNCSCFGAQGCLKVGKTLTRKKDASGKKWVIRVTKKLEDTNDIKSGKCSVKYVNRSNHKSVKLASICGTNKQRFNMAINIKCQTTHPSPTPTTPVTTTTPTPTPSICVGPQPVANVRVTCPNCNGQGATPTDNGSNQ